MPAQWARDSSTHGGAMEREDRRLEAAVALGIITAAQAAAIRDLAPAGGSARKDAEAPRAFNAATIAYVIGAITVVVAMGWFLADRWEWLGAGGVLAVAVLYAALFLLVARVLGREGFQTAAGFAVLLAVLMTPVASVALNELMGWFTSRRAEGCYYPDFLFWNCRGEEFVVELATALAALVALRFRRFSLLVAPLIAVALRMLFHAGDALGRNGAGDATAGWVWVVGASLLAAAAYATDRRQRGDEDFALWLHVAAVMAGVAATTQLLQPYREFRHLMVPGAFIAFAAALTMRRFPWLLLGMGWFVFYLAWLASDVFRESPFFPIVLAALGILVIVATVWVQRNAASLMARFGGVTSDGRPRFPGGIPLLLAPALVALLMFSHGRSLDRERQDELNWQSRRWRMQMAREAAARRATGDTLPPQPKGRETPQRP
jgi:hypothetical protein